MTRAEYSNRLVCLKTGYDTALSCVPFPSYSHLRKGAEDAIYKAFMKEVEFVTSMFFDDPED